MKTVNRPRAEKNLDEPYYVDPPQLPKNEGPPPTKANNDFKYD